MFGFALIFCVLVTLIPVAISGQQLPGQWENQAPGQHTRYAGEAAEIARLKLLVSEQDKMITLLKQKVKVMEAQSQTAR